MGGVRARFDRVMAGETTHSAAQPYHVPAPDGRIQEGCRRLVETPLRVPDGRMTHIVESGEDITGEVKL